MKQESVNKRLGIVTYLLLFAIQMFGSDFIVWQDLPAFRQLVLSPGEQPASTAYDGNTVLAVLFAMQVAYWYRLLRVAIPFRGPKPGLEPSILVLGPTKFHFWKRTILCRAFSACA